MWQFFVLQLVFLNYVIQSWCKQTTHLLLSAWILLKQINKAILRMAFKRLDAQWLRSPPFSAKLEPIAKKKCRRSSAIWCARSRTGQRTSFTHRLRRKSRRLWTTLTSSYITKSNTIRRQVTSTKKQKKANRQVNIHHALRQGFNATLKIISCLESQYLIGTPSRPNGNMQIFDLKEK